MWGETDLRQLILHLLLASPPAVFVGVLSYVVVITVAVRVLGWGLRPGHHLVDSRVGWFAWMTERLIGGARGTLFPLYAGLVTPFWLRRLGAHIGKGVEASTVTGIPRFIHADDKSFLADETLVAPAEIRSGWIRLDHARVGARAFAGNSGIVAPGRGIPDGSLVAVLSSAPAHAEPGSSWLGRPAVELPRVADVGDLSRTFDPRKRLVVARAFVEFFRVVPWLVSGVLGFGVLVAFELIQLALGWTVAALVAGPVLLLAGVAAALVTTLSKWLLVGRFRPGQHPLWSSFVWRNELFDVFYEELAVPWFAGPTLGTPLLNAWLRTLGVKIGKGVWCETYWLPETDLVSLGDGVTVNRGCVLQTHLFHDRLMRVDGVTLEAGASLGPNSVILPGAAIGFRAAVGPASLVMRGEAVPARTRWAGNPIISTAGQEAFAVVSAPAASPHPVPAPGVRAEPVRQPVRTPPVRTPPVRTPPVRTPVRRAAPPVPVPPPRATGASRPVPARATPVVGAVPGPAARTPIPRPVTAPRHGPSGPRPVPAPRAAAGSPAAEPRAAEPRAAGPRAPELRVTEPRAAETRVTEPRVAPPRPFPAPRAPEPRPVPAPRPRPAPSAVPASATSVAAGPADGPDRPAAAPPDSDPTTALPVITVGPAAVPAEEPSPGRRHRRHDADDDHRHDVAGPHGRHRGADDLPAHPGPAHARPRHDSDTPAHPPALGVPQRMALLLGDGRFDDDRREVLQAVNGW